MKVEPISFDDIKEGDYIVRIEKSSHDGRIFTIAGIAHTHDSEGFPVFQNIMRTSWMTETGEPLALQDREAGVTLPDFPEGYQLLFRATH
jgi:hypothetical protein